MNELSWILHSFGHLFTPLTNVQWGRWTIYSEVVMGKVTTHSNSLSLSLPLFLSSLLFSSLGFHKMSGRKIVLECLFEMTAQSSNLCRWYTVWIYLTMQIFTGTKLLEFESWECLCWCLHDQNSIEMQCWMVNQVTRFNRSVRMKVCKCISSTFTLILIKYFNLPMCVCFGSMSLSHSLSVYIFLE